MPAAGSGPGAGPRLFPECGHPPHAGARGYGITGLIVGAAAAKVGLFKALWLGLLAFKKVLVIGLMALVGALKRCFNRKREEPVPTEQGP